MIGANPTRLPMNVVKYHGVVTGSSSQVGPASTISYTVIVNFPTGPKQLTGVVPFGNRYPDTLDIRAAVPGTIVDVYDLDGILQFQITELPDFGECP